MGDLRLTSEDMYSSQSRREEEHWLRISRRLTFLYQDHAEEVLASLKDVCDSYRNALDQNLSCTGWSEADVLLITYADSVVSEQEKPLGSLLEFIQQYLAPCISAVHILPFFPYSSDDGFSVIDYRVVREDLGDWPDIRLMSEHFDLMVDLVINHVSRESLWFADYVANLPPARDFFLELPADSDVSSVTRPRNTPLLVPVNTHRGMKYVWATFSEDQIDLNFKNPEVLLEFVDIMLFYFSMGARYLRLDAIAFLWKQLGTACVHLRETHEVVKLLRDIIEMIAPDRILITETNVPNRENLSYFGQGDEAHLVYQFPLPPLVLHAMNRGSAEHLTSWAQSLPELPDNCSYLNFTASHDGIGLRALEGMISEGEVENLIQSMYQFGGFISMKANPNGEDTPYEINISYFDAMSGTRRGPDQWQVARFICSQAIMLSLQGIPAFYIHSLVATPNDRRGVEISGRTRSINRKKWNRDELEEVLSNPATPNHEVLRELSRLSEIRRSHTCFHPSCPQEVLEINNGIFGIVRRHQQGKEVLIALHNVTQHKQPITIKNRPDISDANDWFDLISGKNIEGILPLVSLEPYQVMWLVKH